MKCPVCNQEIAEDSKVCEHCGAQIEQSQEEAQTVFNTGSQEETQTVFNTQPQEESQTVFNAQPEQESQAETSAQPEADAQQASNAQPQQASQTGDVVRIPGKLIAGIIGLIAIAVIAYMLVTTHKVTIDLNDYVKVNFEGYDSFGTASIDFDYDKFYKDISKSRKLKKDLKDVDEIHDLDDLEDALANFGVYAVLASVSWDLDKDEELSNGDKVKVTFTYDNDMVADVGLKYTAKDKEFEVKGLDKIKEIDPFEDITVTFSGTSPDCDADVENNSTEEAVRDLYFTLDKSYNIKKGDTVTVSVDADEEYLIREYGCKLKTTSKEYVCDNVDEYISTFSDIDTGTLANMKKQTEDVINAYFADYKDDMTATGLTYEGCYFLTVKDVEYWGDKNIIYVVYSATVKSKEKAFKATKVFLPVKFDDAIKYADGTIYLDLNKTYIEGRTDLALGWFSTVSGYTDKTAMQNELVTAKQGDYNFEASDNLQ